MTNGEVEQFVADPVEFFGGSRVVMHAVPADELRALQLAGLKLRFAELRERIPVLQTMASELGIERIAELDDVVPLLFPHTLYKSYPLALLEKRRFDALTRWLDRLTALDLSDVRIEGCQSIDSWLDALDEQTELRVSHSSGTTGKLSLLPRTAADFDRLTRTTKCGLFDSTGPDDDGFCDVIWPTFRHGRQAVLRAADFHVKYYAGSEDRLHALHPGTMSADVMALAGRLRAAASRGELEELEASLGLRERRAEVVALQEAMAKDMPRFLDKIIEDLRSRRIYLAATWNLLNDFAQAGLARGLNGVFAPDSVIVTGGGAKHQVVPEGWEEDVARFTGVPRLQHIYGMSEVLGIHRMCEHERFHIEPWVALFVLDPDDGAPLPREGVQTGRAAFYDLMPESSWGGFVSGDEVTVDWSRCACGRTTPHLARSIERYGDKQGGDDKITCAAAADAHESALEFLNGVELV